MTPREELFESLEPWHKILVQGQLDFKNACNSARLLGIISEAEFDQVVKKIHNSSTGFFWEKLHQLPSWADLQPDHPESPIKFI